MGAGIFSRIHPLRPQRECNFSWLCRPVAAVWGGSVSLRSIFIFAIFYFLLILPQQRRQKKWQGMLDQLKTGDKVTTSGGLRGTIMAIKDDCIHLRVPPNNLVVEVTKASVTAGLDERGRSQRRNKF